MERIYKVGKVEGGKMREDGGNPAGDVTAENDRAEVVVKRFGGSCRRARRRVRARTVTRPAQERVRVRAIWGRQYRMSWSVSFKLLSKKCQIIGRVGERDKQIEEEGSTIPRQKYAAHPQRKRPLTPSKPSHLASQPYNVPLKALINTSYTYGVEATGPHHPKIYIHIYVGDPGGDGDVEESKDLDKLEIKGKRGGQSDGGG